MIEKVHELKKIHIRHMLRVSMAMCLLMISLKAFRLSVINTESIFVMPIAEWPFYALFFAVFIISFFYGIIQIEKDEVKAITPFMVNMFTLFIVLFTPLTHMAVMTNFERKITDRFEIIDMVENRDFVSFNEVIRLPEAYKHVSKGGKIMTEERDNSVDVFFYTFRGVSGNFSGFVYKADDEKPIRGDFGCDRPIEIEAIESGWFWMACS